MKQGLYILFGIALSKACFAQAVPPSPYVDHAACPYEGCFYGEWTTLKETPLYRSQSTSSPILFTVKPGEKVTASTGDVITLQPGIVEILTDTKEGEDKKIDLKKGDVFYELNDVGEGNSKGWFKGQTFITAEDSKKYRYARPKKTVWWIKIVNRQGQSGWTKQSSHFGDRDRFG